MFILLMFYLLGFFGVCLAILFLFFVLSKKVNFDFSSSSSFECGFSSLFFSRFSFSMHYFLVALVFLFLDLELCYLLPFFNQDYSSIFSILFFICFVVLLVIGLFKEWKSGMLDWKF